MKTLSLLNPKTLIESLKPDNETTNIFCREGDEHRDVMRKLDLALEATVGFRALGQSVGFCFKI